MRWDDRVKKRMFRCADMPGVRVGWVVRRGVRCGNSLCGLAPDETHARAVGWGVPGVSSGGVGSNLGAFTQPLV